MTTALDYSKLRACIRMEFGTQKRFAERIGMSQSALSARLNNKTDFWFDEILAICKVLHIPPQKIKAYFFTEPGTEEKGSSTYESEVPKEI